MDGVLRNRTGVDLCPPHTYGYPHPHHIGTQETVPQGKEGEEFETAMYMTSHGLTIVPNCLPACESEAIQTLQQENPVTGLPEERTSDSFLLTPLLLLLLPAFCEFSDSISTP